VITDQHFRKTRSRRPQPALEVKIDLADICGEERGTAFNLVSISLSLQMGDDLLIMQGATSQARSDSETLVAADR
jgi:hypothetical protein